MNSAVETPALCTQGLGARLLGTAALEAAPVSVSPPGRGGEGSVQHRQRVPRQGQAAVLECCTGPRAPAACRPRDAAPGFRVLRVSRVGGALGSPPPHSTHPWPRPDGPRRPKTRVLELNTAPPSWGGVTPGRGRVEATGSASSGLGGRRGIAGRDTTHTYSASRRNLSLVKELGDRAAQGRAYGNLGNTHYLLGSFTEATTFHKEVSGVARLGAGAPGLPPGTQMLGWLCRARGQPRDHPGLASASSAPGHR